jgi:hypothetical protein
MIYLIADRKFLMIKKMMFLLISISNLLRGMIRLYRKGYKRVDLQDIWIKF